MYLMMKQIVASVAVALGLLAGGCGDSKGLNPRELCVAVVESVCFQFYACLSEEERMGDGFPATEAECVTLLQDDFACELETEQTACFTGETYDGNVAESCANQIAALSCTQVREAETDLQAAAPSCARVCIAE